MARVSKRLFGPLAMAFEKGGVFSAKKADGERNEWRRGRSEREGRFSSAGSF
jgi:hypothetical protein